MRLTGKSVLDQVEHDIRVQLDANRRNFTEEDGILVGGLIFRASVNQDGGKYDVKVTVSCPHYGCIYDPFEKRFRTWFGWIPFWISIQIQGFVNQHAPR